MSIVLSKEENYKNQVMLFDAVNNNDLESVNKLLDKSVNVNIVNKDSQTPLDLAIKLSHWSIIKLLVNNDAKVYCSELSQNYEAI
jgi:ankyrin repeat protein